jgi:hypothetical protein
MIRKHILLPWAVAFILLNLFVTQYGGKNALARIAAIRSITENHSLDINHYKEWTIDLAYSPNGNTYSNKAPGAVFLGLPFLFLTDKINDSLGKSVIDEFGRRQQPLYWQHLVLVFCTQVLPYAFLVLYIGTWLLEIGLPPMAIHFFALSAFFANTAAIFMNSYFGHGLAALLLLAAIVSVLRRNYFFSTLCFGFAMLTDYGVATVIPGLLVFLILQEGRGILKKISLLFLGALFPAALWIWYHWTAFGSPFAVATQFIDTDHITGFQPAIVFALLFGPERGILFTQSWILVTLLCFGKFFHHERTLGLAVFCILGLAGMLGMTASFSGWHGGWSAGPRYICVIFPVFSLLAAFLYADANRVIRALLLLGLGAGIAFRLFIYPHSILAPNEALWPYYWRETLAHPDNSLLRLALAGVTLALAALWVKSRSVKLK